MVMRTFLVYAVVELAVLAALTWTIGLGWAVLLLLGTSVLGVALAGSQVKRQILRLQRTGNLPQGAGGAVADGMLVALGTVLVFVPGLVTTVLGALMLLPPTRTAVRPLAGMMLARGLSRRVTVVNLTPPMPTATYSDRPGLGDYIDGEVIEDKVYGPVHDVAVVRRRD